MSKSKTAALKKDAFPTGNYTPHLLASLVPGEMSPEEFNALCASIREDGLQNSITLYEGQILDGRHRWQALCELGIKPTAQMFTTFKGPEKDAAALVLDNNLHRRQLNSMQKALVAAHMHTRIEASLTQKDAAAKVGVGVATVNLAVRLLQSKNTPLIKRCEHGDATRAEIDELLFDRAASQRQEQIAADAITGATDSDDEGEEGEAITSAPGNKVVSLRPGNMDTKVSHPERRAKETSVSKCVAHFKALSEHDRKQFVLMAWGWLKPALDGVEKMRAERTPPQPGTRSAPPLAKTKGGKRSKAKGRKAA